MPRAARLTVAGVPWHVYHRGHDKDPCFFDGSDYAFYLNQLHRLSRDSGCAVHAHALMTNHVHLLLTPDSESSVARMMKVLGQLVSQRANRRMERRGAFWEGRYRSNLVQTSEYLMRCYRYIELNPVRAGIVARPRDYPWSSYKANAEGEFSPLIQPHDLYLALGGTDEARREAYRAFCGVPVPACELDFLRRRSRNGQPIGDSRFEEEIGWRTRQREVSVPKVSVPKVSVPKVTVPILTILT
jgi:putative transposase